MKNHQKNVVIASRSGFCYGVKRAVETTKQIKKNNPDKKIFILGELIHNSDVINELSALGIETVETLVNPAPKDAVCVIRSHGVSLDLIEKIKQMGYDVLDLTCPDVKKAQNRAVDFAKNGYFVIILGKSEHPEVAAIEQNAKKYAKTRDSVLVIKSLDELIKNAELVKNKNVAIVVQTTQKIEFLKEIVSYLLDVVKNLTIANTICPSTVLRQKDARELGKVSDLMVVAGSKKSANTTHLAEILSGITKTIHIESDEELKNYIDLIENSQNIGITAGASTPDYVIEKIKKQLERIK